jgi:hypothetical protein
LQTSLHGSLVSASSVLQAKRHGDIAVGSIWGDEGCLDLIRLAERDLVIARVGIQEGQQVTAGCGIDYLVDAWQREWILRVGLVEAGVLGTVVSTAFARSSVAPAVLRRAVVG